jgi:uncharacterized lipoprotein YddW (UPF0748 family)
MSLARCLFTFTTLCYFGWSLSLFAAPPNPTPPKREFRAVWVASVFNINWPKNATDAPTKQRQEFITLLNECRASGFNAVIVQVRPSADALYTASREPWSQWLTGTQGKQPSPLWDPLAFMIAETHKRGMEFHAWFNPYRSVVSAKSAVSQYHIARTRPDWHLTFDNPYKLLNPGLPQVRDYVTSVVMDVVKNYDVDGVHFDDYFYPYGGTGGQDAITFSRYNRGIANIADWRRDNVNLLVKTVYDSIRATKPHVKFGVSPFGVWKTGVPAGIMAADTMALDLYGAYSVIYCDALAWLQQQTVDYVMPQLYWGFGGKKDYAKLMPWWLAQTRGRHLYTGNAAYKMNGSSNWPASEIASQLRFNRAQGAHGCSLYNVAFVTGNTKGLQDSLRRDLFRSPALPPVMLWKDSTPPLPPTGLTLRIHTHSAHQHGKAVLLTWQESEKASDGEGARFYAVYRFSDKERVNTDDPRALCGITPDTQFMDTEAKPNERYTYVVTALDRLWNESETTTRVGKLR